MKLKERLSIDYADHEDYFDKHDQDLNISQAYLAGFDKCKELILKTYDDMDVLQNFIGELNKLGEEEV